ncbi:MAG: hypothetical protein IH591_07055 [Bacteroidales bacterium]|nr:hypothetical protein [Bacteroidales bacterium]
MKGFEYLDNYHQDFSAGRIADTKGVISGDKSLKTEAVTEEDDFQMEEAVPGSNSIARKIMKAVSGMFDVSDEKIS